ncbi:unnamed protein product [Moneuplotes crassus]|uniref:Dihydrolipoamide acetyltransferase component of pyruvate dehydrogenase complex n=1 Tax=Euplotes crassus TaxID=5936 RepID=A0AAD1UQF7_EUPCR|nr:unnamed protein product [Moneuplotes crassus]
MFALMSQRRAFRSLSSLYRQGACQSLASNTALARYFSQMIQIKLPDLGEGTKEATIKEWFVKKGEEIDEFEEICEVFTDKLVAQIPSTHKGILKKIYYQDDEICQVGSTLADVELLEGDQTNSEESAEENIFDETSAAQASMDSFKEDNKSQTGGEKVLATPSTRNYAKTKDVDITKVLGSGEDGRITNADIDNFLSKSTSQPRGKRHIPQQPSLTGVTDKDQVKPIGGVLKGMVKTMTESLSIPFFTHQDEYDATQLMKLRQELKLTNKKLTLLPFFIKAISLSLRNNPGMNVHVNPETDEDGYIKEYVIKHDHNIAVAIDSPNGLVVPVIHKVQNKSIIEINNCILELRDKAATGKLTKEDYSDGTFSVSSVGNLGGTYFVPTILRPQGAIVAIGKATKKPKYIEGANDLNRWEPIDAINFSFSCDHRVIAGATCVRFSEDIRKLIENPQNMLLSMN